MNQPLAQNELEYYIWCSQQSLPEERVKWTTFAFAHVLKQLTKDASCANIPRLKKTCVRLLREVEGEQAFIENWIESDEKILVDLLTSTIETIKSATHTNNPPTSRIYKDVHETNTPYKSRLRNLPRVNYSNM
jgi:hypothetical protein